ncbi:hypothetical protein OY671_002050 [Metschnikowia pulcherrima]|nr:hypothetical protein OY671_002050 [Metschnikowia pulcherrima]
MEFYDPVFTRQLAPLVKVALSTGPVAEVLQKYLDRAQLVNPIWDNVILKNRLSATKFCIRYAESEQSIESKVAAHKSKAADTHSSISPFNSESDLFPSGVISKEWFGKYADDVPFAVVCTYTLGVDQGSDNELAEALADNRRKYLAYNIRFVAIVVSHGTEDDVSDRLSHLRHVSGLANLSNLFFLSEAEDLESHCELLVSSLLTSLKSSATDFYSDTAHRVKQRFNKYYTMPRSHVRTSIELSPKILETRNTIKQGILLQLMHPHNIEASLPLLEQAYTNLFELIVSNSTHFFSKSRTPHDQKVYVQWRTLLDVIAIHIVRGKFSIEEPVTAMKRQRKHVETVEAFLTENTQPGIKVWKAIQDHWLAELMSLLPDSLMQELRSGSPKNRNKDSIEYSGGLLFSDGSVVATSPHLVYKRAASWLHAINSRDTLCEVFGHSFTDVASILSYKVRLLEHTIKALPIADSIPNASFEVFMLIEIADSCVGLKAYKKAIDTYKVAQSKLSTQNWASIHQMVSKKIIVAASLLDDSHTALAQLACLSVSRDPVLDSLSNDWSINEDSTINLESEVSFVNVDCCLFNQTFDHEIRVSDTVITQVRLNRLFDPTILGRAIPGSKVTLTINHIDIRYESDRLVRCKGLGDQAGMFQNAAPGGDEAHFNFASFGELGLILQLRQTASTSGWYSVNEIVVSLTVNVEVDGNNLQLRKEERTAVDHHRIKQTFDVAVGEKNGEVKTKRKDSQGRNSCKVFVKPYRPHLGIEIDSKPQSIIIGEKFETSIVLSIPETGGKELGCKSVRVSMEPIIYDDMIETKSLHAQVNFDTFKDDEPMELLDAYHMEQTERKHKLNVRLTKSPSSQIPEDANLKLVLYFKLTSVDVNGEVSEFDITQLTMRVLERPFSQTLSISPRLHTENTSSIPNPFVLDSSTERHSMPSISRSWLLQSQVQDKYKLLQQGTIFFSSVELQIRSATPEISVTWVNDMTVNDQNYARKFVTAAKHRPTTTKVNLIATAKYTYKRVGSSTESSFETDEKEFIFQLQDPRVLLYVERQDENVHLKYIIENPTSRIFTYASTLTTDKAMSRGISWDFEDVRNESPLKQAIIPVLPFSQHKLEYYARYSAEERDSDSIELPHLQVQDMQFKVNLPTVTLQQKIEVTESGLVMNV